ncbi:MAG: hypothetical protein GKS00_24735 [Alphaproteobacteria bacterium]|nr:hypothetical protein [Alphaproteobacteria bacterium]
MCRSEPIANYDPNVSAYLQRPLRTYEEALRDLQRAARNRMGIAKPTAQDQCSHPARDTDTHDDKE